MKFTSGLFIARRSPGGGRSPQPENKVPFQEILPLKLKERVSGKSDRSKEGGCLHEMSLLMTCLQENEHENKLCQKQVDNLNLCYKNYLKDRFYSKKAQEKGVLVPTETNFTRKQIKKLFEMRPLPH